MQEWPAEGIPAIPRRVSALRRPSGAVASLPLNDEQLRGNGEIPTLAVGWARTDRVAPHLQHAAHLLSLVVLGERGWRGLPADRARHGLQRGVLPWRQVVRLERQLPAAGARVSVAAAAADLKKGAADKEAEKAAKKALSKESCVGRGRQHHRH